MKNVLITGASKGIGKGIAYCLFNAGYKVFLTARNTEALSIIASDINASYISCDLSNKDDLVRLENFIEENKIDILINNAGEYIYSNIEDMDYKAILNLYKTNLAAPAFLCKSVTNNMKTNKWGRIINVGSISGVMGEPFASIYSSSKAGLIGLSKALALELAEYNITVNVINPGWVDTEMCSGSIESSDFSKEEIMNSIPQKRFVSPEEVAKLLLYLISEDAKGITGQSINLCAGLSLGI